jgi:hypothetical protein
MITFILYQQLTINSLQIANDEVWKNLKLHHLSMVEESPESTSLRSTPKVVVESAPKSNDKSFKKSPPPIAPTKKNDVIDTDRTTGGLGSYGGAGDEAHLGGFTEQDNNTISHNYWNYMLGPLTMKSVIDIGCGRGYSAKYFKDNGKKRVF